MATNAEQKSSTDSVPAGAALLGLDGEGARHYVSNPVHGAVTVYVKEQSGEVRTFDLADTPCHGVGGPDAQARGWWDHIADKRGWAQTAEDILAGDLEAIEAVIEA